MVAAVWVAILVYEEFKRPLPPGLVSQSTSQWTEHALNFFRDAQPAAFAGLLTLSCVAWAWSSLSLSLPLGASLAFSFLSTSIGALFARFPIPERASPWLLRFGIETPRLLQMTLLSTAALLSLLFLMNRLTKQYEKLNRDRLALSPGEEDLAIRDLVQSVVTFFIILLGGFALWNVANLRPSPAIARADLRDPRPTVLLFAVDNDSYARLIKERMGEPFYKSWIVFGSPQTGAQFDEVLQCRYPIRLVGPVHSTAKNYAGDVNSFFVPSALERGGYSVSLLHSSAFGETSQALKMLSRNFAHIRFFRRFGLLLPSRVFYTPDVQLSQMREALSLSVNLGKPAFLTGSLLSREGRIQTEQDIDQFETFLQAMWSQNWLKNIMFILLEFPRGAEDKNRNDLSLGATSAQVSFWSLGSLADSTLIPNPPKLVRGIDLGASLAARLRLSSVVSHCDGAALFDISERPSVFPRDLVYQETNLSVGEEVFRKRGWLTSDGYRLEIQESQDGALSRTFKYSLKMGSYNRSWQPVDETVINEPRISLELNRQLEDFLRSSGVEILSLGNGLNAYSEPFRKIRMLDN